MVWRCFGENSALSNSWDGWELAEDSVLFTSLEWIILDKKQALPLLSVMKAGSSRREKINFDTQKVKDWEVKNCSHDGSFWKWFLFWEHSLYKKRDLCKWDRGYEASGSRPVFHLEPAKVSFWGGGSPHMGAGLLLPFHPLYCPSEMPLLLQGVLPWAISFLICWHPFWAMVVGGGWKEGVVCFKAMSHFKVLVFLETDFFLLRFPERNFAKQ